MAVLSLLDQKHIGSAGLESKKSDLVSKHGCVIVSNGKIIGKGHNSSRTQSSDGFLKNTCSCHAEVDAIRNAFHSKNSNCYSKFRYKEKQCFLRR